MIFCELLISLVLYVVALEMMDLQQLKEAHSQTIPNMRTMQQALKEIALTVAYLQQGNEVKPIVAFFNRSSKSQGILNWETQIAPKRVGDLGKVKIRVKASEILPYVGGVKGKCHMTEHNIGYKTVTSSKSVKRNIGKNKKAMKMKQLQVDPPSSHCTLKPSVKQKV